MKRANGSQRPGNSSQLSRSTVSRVLGLLSICLALSLMPASARAAGWKVAGSTAAVVTGPSVYSYDANWILHPQPAALVPGWGLGFLIPFSPVAALLTVSSQQPLDLTGRTISSTVGISVAGSPTFTYGTEPDPCNGPPSVHLFFSTSAQTYDPGLASSGSNEVNYWWSNPSGATLQALKSTTSTISVALQGGNWSDANGHWGSDPAYAAGFAAAVRNIRQIGLSFGGGCYFDNGVGVQPGTGYAAFRILSYTVS